ncbi:Myotubularin-related protein 4 [Manis javanica]|nr:Myotubularin-related protein 4 [Manis javanica]
MDHIPIGRNEKSLIWLFNYRLHFIFRSNTGRENSIMNKLNIGCGKVRLQPDYFSFYKQIQQGLISSQRYYERKFSILHSQ